MWVLEPGGHAAARKYMVRLGRRIVRCGLEADMFGDSG